MLELIVFGIILFLIQNAGTVLRILLIAIGIATLIFGIIRIRKKLRRKSARNKVAKTKNKYEGARTQAPKFTNKHEGTRTQIQKTTNTPKEIMIGGGTNTPFSICIGCGCILPKGRALCSDCMSDRLKRIMAGSQNAAEEIEPSDEYGVCSVCGRILPKGQTLCKDCTEEHVLTPTIIRDCSDSRSIDYQNKVKLGLIPTEPVLHTFYHEYAFQHEHSSCHERKRRSVSLAQRQRILRRDNFTCQLCGAKGPIAGGTAVLHVDHKKPFSRGGSDNDDNLWTLCSECNIGKSNKYDDTDLADQLRQSVIREKHNKSSAAKDNPNIVKTEKTALVSKNETSDTAKIENTQVFYEFTCKNRSTGQLFTRRYGGKDLKEVIEIARKYHGKSDVMKVVDCQTNKTVWSKKAAS